MSLAEESGGVGPAQGVGFPCHSPCLNQGFPSFLTKRLRHDQTRCTSTIKVYHYISTCELQPRFLECTFGSSIRKATQIKGEEYVMSSCPLSRTYHFFKSSEATRIMEESSLLIQSIIPFQVLGLCLPLTGPGNPRQGKPLKK